MFLLMLRNIFRALYTTPYEVYTDGSFKNGYGSWAYVIVRKGKVLRESSGRARKTSSNPMEFQAAIEALKSLPEGAHITLYSDSRILIDTITLWSSEWKAQGWLKKNGGPIPFVEQIRVLDALTETHSISWKWVKAHAGNEYNERCDELCIRARTQDLFF
jgi:ribonuclease HI